uniref:AlNc14C6G845 protein n=1 Tax=Albugo laibachii Nc14 TaxID=890382 RepID=F0W169_9STRA|nr:AlNc14C6G845 [Albugo laibachii Nc14]|eukprot:CCA14794.1 AlNc14C6G845 [Albugo laibachii Nc14]
MKSVRSRILGSISVLGKLVTRVAYCNYFAFNRKKGTIPDTLFHIRKKNQRAPVYIPRSDFTLDTKTTVSAKLEKDPFPFVLSAPFSLRNFASRL